MGDGRVAPGALGVGRWVAWSDDEVPYRGESYTVLTASRGATALLYIVFQYLDIFIVGRWVHRPPVGRWLLGVGCWVLDGVGWRLLDNEVSDRGRSYGVLTASTGATNPHEGFPIFRPFFPGRWVAQTTFWALDVGRWVMAGPPPEQPPPGRWVAYPRHPPQPPAPCNPYTSPPPPPQPPGPRYGATKASTGPNGPSRDQGYMFWSECRGAAKKIFRRWVLKIRRWVLPTNPLWALGPYSLPLGVG